MRQLTLLGGAVMAAGEVAVDPGASYGEVFTRRWVVEFILDLVQYTEDADLGACRLVEPSCGQGAFLIPVVDRLVASARRHGRAVESLRDAIRAFDLLDANAKVARKAVSARLQDAGLKQEQADTLADRWIVTGDFLLHEHEGRSADFVVGNPPYIRLEDVPRDRMAAYRAMSATMRGRADLYIGFMEIGLSLLRPGGALGFICADRWMRNQYGAGLRAVIGSLYAVETVVSMHDVDAFEDDVSAYPAVVVLRNESQGTTRVVDARQGFDARDAAAVVEWVGKPSSVATSGATFEASRLHGWFDRNGFWPYGTPAQLALIADIERRFPPLENRHSGTRVGIGVATGCDDVYITCDPSLVESDRLMPLLRPADVSSGTVEWSGAYLVNPWDADGLVDLREHPRLESYLRQNARRLQRRHIAQKRPASWYRTIDRVRPELLHRPKLVLPDIKASANPVLEDGGFYPHHNLYYVTSETWDLEVLGALLMCDVTNLFVGAYCVRMRGGTYRFQAQYLRRIRLPEQSAIDPGHSRDLKAAFRARDVAAANEVAAVLFGIDPQIPLVAPR